jgi:hypothetical protein
MGPVNLDLALIFWTAAALLVCRIGPTAAQQFRFALSLEGQSLRTLSASKLAFASWSDNDHVGCIAANDACAIRFSYVRSKSEIDGTAQRYRQSHRNSTLRCR